MKSTVRLVIFDVYGTLLHVIPEPNPAKVFASLCKDPGPDLPKERVPSSWEEFVALADEEIRSVHAFARSAGVDYPEIFWPEIVGMVLGTEKVTPPIRQFSERVMKCYHSVEPIHGALEILSFLRSLEIPCGIASNAQPYTESELLHSYAGTDFSLSWFEADFCFWSWKLGVSKPSPLLFQMIAARAATAGIRREEILFVGDRLDNDIEPAHRAGFQTWHCPGMDPFSGLRAQLEGVL